MILFIFLGLLGIQLFLLSNLQFTAWPEMLSYPYLRNEGFLLYRDMIHPYPPLLTMLLSLVYKFFGYDLLVLKTVAWSIIGFSSILVFLLIDYITGKKSIAILGLLFYVLLQPFFEGNMLWFDMAIVPPVLLGAYFALRWLREKEDKFLPWASLFFSVAALTKQTAALFLITLGLYVLFRRFSWDRLFKLIIAPVVLLAPFLIQLVREGALQDFINWTILYPLGEWGKFPGYVQMSLSKTQLAVLAVLVLPILVVNIVQVRLGLTAFNAGRRKVFTEASSLLLGIFLLVSILMVYPRFSYFHFQLALAFVILNLAILVKLWNMKRVILLFGVMLVAILPLVHKPVVAVEWQKEARFYGEEDVILADKIADLTDPEEKVFLLGLHSGLYIMADRIPPKRWTDNFGWYLEIPGVQEEIIARWGEKPPSLVVWRQPQHGNWFDLGVYQPQKIVEYIKNNYTFTDELMTGVQTWIRK